MKRLIANINIPSNVKREVNRYLADFCKQYRYPDEVRGLWEYLYDNYKIECLITGMGQKSNTGTESWTVDYEYNGEKVDNSRLIYQVYKPNDSNRYEYNIYLS